MATPRIYGGLADDERRAERRRRLHEAGYNLLATGGASAVTVTGVCKDAGLSPRYFYEHFDNREALIKAILETDAEVVIGYITESGWNAPGGVQQRGEAAVEALLNALDADPRRAALGRATARDDLILRYRSTVTRRMTGELASQLNQLPEFAGRSDQVMVASSLIMVGINQLVIDWLDGTVPMKRRELIELAVRYARTTLALVLDRDPTPPARSLN